MKYLPILAILTVFLFSCKSYLEYTSGTKELNYSFPIEKTKRYANLEKALKSPDDVIFLDISSNSFSNPNEGFKKLNESLPKFKNLKKLTLTCYGIENSNFPKNIFNCHHLEFLVISGFRQLNHNHLSQLSDLKNIVFLSLGNCNLKSIPDQVLQLKSLEGLDLGLNNIASIPAEIGQLKNLRTIDLTNNCLKTFPMNLAECTKLEWIDVNNAEGSDKEALDRLGYCMNEIDNIQNLDKFNSLKELSLFQTMNADDINKLKVTYPHIKF